jgi:L-fuconolactonase
MLKVDTHHHFWNLSEVAYPWLTVAAGPIYADFAPTDLLPQLQAAGIDRTVLVQSCDSYADTASMLVHSDYNDWIGAVIGWVDLLHPDKTAADLDRFGRHPKFRGMRHLIHGESNPDWLVQRPVIESLRVMAQRGMIFEVVPVFPNHLKHVPTLSEKVPELKMVIDHLANPPMSQPDQMREWARQLKAAAQSPNVSAKISGLGTAAKKADWSADDLRRPIDVAVECFTPDRLMFGSDWPVCTLAGDYARVWAETNKAISGCAPTERDAILGGTAVKVYRL